MRPPPRLLVYRHCKVEETGSEEQGRQQIFMQLAVLGLIVLAPEDVAQSSSTVHDTSAAQPLVWDHSHVYVCVCTRPM